MKNFKQEIILKKVKEELKIKGGKIEVDQVACDGCKVCIDVCPHDALSMRTLSKEEVKALTKLKNEVLKSGVPIRKEVKMTFNGIINYYDLIIRPWIGESDKVLGVVCTATNVSELSEAIHELASIQKKK